MCAVPFIQLRPLFPKKATRIPHFAPYVAFSQHFIVFPKGIGNNPPPANAGAPFTERGRSTTATFTHLAKAFRKLNASLGSREVPNEREAEGLCVTKTIPQALRASPLHRKGPFNKFSLCASTVKPSQTKSLPWVKGGGPQRGGRFVPSAS